MSAGEVNMSNKRYTEEFLIEAVRQVVDRLAKGMKSTLLLRTRSK